MPSVALLALGHPSPVAASQGTYGCNPHRTDDYSGNASHSFAGWTHTETTTMVTAATAVINEYSPYVYPDSHGLPRRFVSAWVMLANGPNYYAQIGWREFGGNYTGSLRELFIQATGPTGFFDQAVGPASAPGTNHTFSVYYDADGSFELSMDYTVLYHTLPLGFIPTSAQILGETDGLGDQMPGDLTSATNAAGSSYQILFSNQWIPLSTAQSGTKLLYGRSPTYQSGSAYEAAKVTDNSRGNIEWWDWACPNGVGGFSQYGSGSVVVNRGSSGSYNAGIFALPASAAPAIVWYGVPYYFATATNGYLYARTDAVTIHVFGGGLGARRALVSLGRLALRGPTGFRLSAR